MSDVLNEVNAGKMVAIIRAPSSELLVDVAKAIYEGGIRVIEVTMTVPNALEIIAEVHRQIGDKIILGAGSVIDSETARAAMLAGAEFIVSPVVRHDVIQCCKRYGKAVMPGAFTPTEILTAWEAGADVVKVFPANIGGPGYLKAVKAPLPQVQLMPTGGVNLETLESFMDAGACAVGLGSSLVTKELMAAGDVDGIRNLSVRYVELMERWKASKSK
jgi:2-dehydro-3-deoxyphosphogluconate aldolase/(4S)-4-hydroxy-2-oxoglutarate aldolase